MKLWSIYFNVLLYCVILQGHDVGTNKMFAAIQTIESQTIKCFSLLAINYRGLDNLNSILLLHKKTVSKIRVS